jgi:hypothetical protein
MTETTLSQPGQEQDRERCAEPDCRVPSALLIWDEDTQAYWCNTHSPNEAVRAVRQAGRTRGQLTAQMRLSRRRKAHLVGALDTLEQMEREQARIIEAMGLGDLDARTGDAMLRGIDKKRATREQGIKETRLRILEAEVAALRAERKGSGR